MQSKFQSSLLGVELWVFVFKRKKTERANKSKKRIFLSKLDSPPHSPHVWLFLLWCCWLLKWWRVWWSCCWWWWWWWCGVLIMKKSIIFILIVNARVKQQFCLWILQLVFYRYNKNEVSRVEYKLLMLHGFHFFDLFLLKNGGTGGQHRSK